MTDILTITMNPALDVATSTDTVTDTHKLRCTAPLRYPGGGGINVARVVQRLGADCVALYPVGGAHGQQLRQLLDQEQVRSSCIEIAGETRESFSVRETSSGREFRFVLPGPTLTPPEWQACLDRFAGLDTPPRYLVASGSLPPGVPTDFYARLARLANARGTQVVLDTSRPALAAALKEGVYLVKPSLRELRELTGKPLTDEAQWRDAAQQLVASGQAQVVALSLGEQGALLVTATTTWRGPALPLQVHSATGAGDSFVGAMVWALSRQTGLAEAFRYAVAAGSAALLSVGTGLCSKADVERLYPGVRLTSQ
ncbi:MAG: 1-phosphofructokinase family hexose kinase [Polaromonas sp.]|nr:1-phosphofructokinase family hexose kinase [Polaromonas sp.]